MIFYSKKSDIINGEFKNNLILKALKYHFAITKISCFKCILPVTLNSHKIYN